MAWITLGRIEERAVALGRAIWVARLTARQRIEAAPRCRARRATRRARAPAPARVSPIGARLMRPRDGFKPNRPHTRPECRIEPPRVGHMRHRQRARRHDGRLAARRAAGDQVGTP